MPSTRVQFDIYFRRGVLPESPELGQGEAIHVGDIGTLYRARVLDAGDDFDPTTAIVAELIFALPNGHALRKTATVTTDASPATEWYLDYTVQAGDGIGSPGDFHDNPGPFQVQGFLRFSEGSPAVVTEFSSSIATVDKYGQELRIFPNLDA